MSERTNAHIWNRRPSKRVVNIVSKTAFAAMVIGAGAFAAERKLSNRAHFQDIAGRYTNYDAMLQSTKPDEADAVMLMCRITAAALRPRGIDMTTLVAVLDKKQHRFNSSVSAAIDVLSRGEHAILDVDYSSGAEVITPKSDFLARFEENPNTFIEVERQRRVLAELPD